MTFANRLVRLLEVPGYSADASLSSHDDTQPLPEEQATWGPIDFFAVFSFFAFGLGNWIVGSSMLALGLSVLQSMISVILGLCIVAVVMVIGGLPGSRWRIAEPQAAKLSGGVFGYRATVVIFGAVTVCWFGIQLWWGAKALEVVIVAIIPGFRNIPNTLSADITSSELVCVFLFWIMCLIMIWFPPTIFKTSAKLASVAAFVTFTAIVIICTVKAGGAGPLLKDPYDLVGVSEVPKGSDLAWQMVYGVSIVMAANGAMCVPTYSRLSRSKYAYAPALVLNYVLFSFIIILFGILATSAAVDIFPDKPLLWSPVDLLMAFMERGGSGARAGAFFGGLALLGPQLGINVMVNAWMCGVRWSGLAPRWMTVRRGGYVTACIGLAINPWTIVRHPAGFTKFLNGTAIIVAGIDGIYLSDYFLVRGQHIRVLDLYQSGPSSIYWYQKGWNWRAIAALLFSCWPCFPGLVSYVSNGEVRLASGWGRLYQLSWPLNFVLSGIIYLVLCKLFPPATGSACQVAEVQPSSEPKDVQPTEEKEQKEQRGIA